MTRRSGRHRPPRPERDPDPVLSDPDFLAWAEDRRLRLLPMIQESSVTVSLVPKGPADMKFAVELGLSIMLDKPFIAVVAPGQEVPAKLRAVADRIVVWEPGQSEADLMAALREVVDGWDTDGGPYPPPEE